MSKGWGSEGVECGVPDHAMRRFVPMMQVAMPFLLYLSMPSRRKARNKDISAVMPALGKGWLPNLQLPKNKMPEKRRGRPSTPM